MTNRIAVKTLRQFGVEARPKAPIRLAHLITWYRYVSVLFTASQASHSKRRTKIRMYYNTLLCTLVFFY